jgi:D-alanine--poly(phosphoribitol) ligase subunit 1
MNDILDSLEHAASLFPDKIAIDDNKSSITYGTYLKNAQYIGLSLLNRITADNQPVLVLTNDSAECLITFMGILYSGNFYVPVESKLPEKRLQSMVETIAPCIIIRMTDNDPIFKGVKSVTYYDLLKEGAESFDISMLEKAHSMRSLLDPVFGMFTSGSTGTVKLVLKNMFSIMDMIKQFTDTFSFDQSNVFGNQASFSFDVSAKDIYLSIYHSATLYIIPRNYFSFPAMLTEFISQKRINTLIWTSFAIRLLYEFKAFSHSHIDSVKLVMFSGEALSEKIIEYWLKNTGAKLVNLYGSTETTFNCTYYVINDVPEGRIPIGTSFKNNRVIILNSGGQEAQPFEKGEICVMGTCLSMGYYNNPSKTEASFVQNPLNKKYRELMYRTGDIGYRDENGLIFFVSRKDNQIKHMGYRIELEEIEHEVSKIEGIERCCCVYDEKKEKIILYYQAKEPVDRRILEELKKSLPKHMLPHRLYHKTALPLNINGKVDRVLLKEKTDGNI